jgi:hypothetical protein
VMSNRDKHGAKGHSKKHPDNVFPNASNAETGETLYVTLGQVRGLRLWNPKQTQRDRSRTEGQHRIQSGS